MGLSAWHVSPANFEVLKTGEAPKCDPTIEQAHGRLRAPHQRFQQYDRGPGPRALDEHVLPSRSPRCRIYFELGESESLTRRQTAI